MELYDAIAKDYSTYAAKRQAYLRSVENLVCDYMRPGRWLDIGSGDGLRAASILARVTDVALVPFEPSQEMATLCAANTKCDVVQGDARRLSDYSLGKFATITSLWNVLGHIETSAERLDVLKAIRAHMTSGGLYICDVNNRHNAAAYGKGRVAWRRIIDSLYFDEKRGDARYTWEVNGKSYPAYGHLFTPAEILSAVEEAGFRVVDCRAVDYETGTTSQVLTEGQLFLALAAD